MGVARIDHDGRAGTHVAAKRYFEGVIAMSQDQITVSVSSGGHSNQYQIPIGSGGSGSSFKVDTDGVDDVAGSVISILAEALNDVVALEGLGVAAAAFAGIGTAVAGADLKRQIQLARQLLQLMKLFKQLVDLIQKASKQYREADDAVARSLSGTISV